MNLVWYSLWFFVEIFDKVFIFVVDFSNEKIKFLIDDIIINNLRIMLINYIIR